MFLIIRLYAIFDKSPWILYATVPFGLLNVVLSIVRFELKQSFFLLPLTSLLQLAIASEDEMSFVRLNNEPGVE